MTPLNWTLQKRKTSLHVYMTVHTCLYMVLYAVSTIIIRVVIDKIIHGSQYLRGHTIHEVRGEVAIGPSIYGVYVIDGSLCSRVYGSVFVVCMHAFCFLVPPLSFPVLSCFLYVISWLSGI